MSFLARAHSRGIAPRRVRVLSRHLSRCLPRGVSVLDVGSGDGAIAAALLQLRPDISVSGVDVLPREQSHIPISLFDGATLPFASDSFDTVMLVDVVHHAEQPGQLLREASRVARDSLVIKDHCTDEFLASPTLRFMDWVGNSHQGVNLPYNYWSEAQWRHRFGELGLSIDAWTSQLQLYPWPASVVFDRRLHFLASMHFVAG